MRIAAKIQREAVLTLTLFILALGFGFLAFLESSRSDFVNSFETIYLPSDRFFLILRPTNFNNLNHREMFQMILVLISTLSFLPILIYYGVRWIMIEGIWQLAST